jgi:hypothetical protein
MNCSRRDFGKFAFAALPAASLAAAPNSKVNGVQIGAISYSFRDLPPAQIIPSMLKIGLSEVELMSNHAEALAGGPVIRFGRGGRSQAPTPEMLAVPTSAQTMACSRETGNFHASSQTLR